MEPEVKDTTNKQDTKAYQREYYQKNKEKHIAYMMEYHKKNNDKHKEYMLRYYRKNKDKFDAFSRQKRHCEACNKGYGYTNYAKHLITKKHIKNVEMMDKQNT